MAWGCQSNQRKRNLANQENLTPKVKKMSRKMNYEEHCAEVRSSKLLQLQNLCSSLGISIDGKITIDNDFDPGQAVKYEVSLYPLSSASKVDGVCPFHTEFSFEKGQEISIQAEWIKENTWESK
jgi:hypothetical protein